ncbi:MAG: hypothetical protein U5J82_10430 [Desulfobacterales bacterium]|nr:hypothetical protein [Desulfobacterales bacterium]
MHRCNLPQKLWALDSTTPWMQNSLAANLAEIVVDELLLRHKLLGEGELADMRQAGASNQELVLATVIAKKKDRPTRQIYLESKTEQKHENLF